MKLGIVGTNFISDLLVEAVKCVGEMELFAVYSRKKETGSLFAEKHGIPSVYTDYEQFLNSDVEAVYIATPTCAHNRQTIEALQHGKHVLCEKILAVNEKEVSAMFDCAKKNQVVLLEAMRPDFDPAFDLVKQALPKIGKLRRVTMEFCQYSSRYDKFRAGEVLNAFNPDLSNAAIMDIGVYCIHTIARFFGMPEAVKAFSTKLENGFEGSGIVLMQYPGFTAEAVYSKITNSVNPSVFEGEEGSILVDSVSVPKHMNILYRDGRKEEIPYIAKENNMVYEVGQFLKLIHEKCIEHVYCVYSQNTAKVVDEARKQNGIVFHADSVL